MFCPRLKILLLDFMFKNALKPEKQAVFSGKKVKSLHKYCPVATGKTFSPKFILAAKVQKQ